MAPHAHPALIPAGERPSGGAIIVGMVLAQLLGLASTVLPFWLVHYNDVDVAIGAGILVWLVASAVLIAIRRTRWIGVGLAIGGVAYPVLFLIAMMALSALA